MKFTLKDYQADAVADVLANLIDAREDYHRPRPRLSAFSLSAVTGAGKTVMAAAVIEALFAGNDDFNFAPDPGAVVLWFTSDPSLNEQTRHRILQATEEIPYSRLVAIGNTFAGDRLEPGHVYFLNSQKLAARSLLVRGGTLADAENMLIAPDRRANTFWDVLRNTIEDPALTLYVILDEAHRGMKRPNRNERAEKSTIVRQLVNGEAGAPPVPVVLGISATVERFNQAMADSSGRTLLPNVVVDPARVQESGLLKDDIRLDFPAETGTFDTVLLRRGVRRVKESTQHWADYHRAQETTEDPVIPLLVVQVPNTPSDQMLLDALQAIADEWPELGDANIAHVFGEHTDLVIGGRVIGYISPEHVQQRTAIRVLLAKDAISTGWDCPRAEVLVSYRPAQDDTHITQLLGRMVRTPLARRIPGDDRLNSVECILPFFERSTARKVVELLLGVASSDGDDDDLDAGGGSGGGDGRRVLLGPIDMHVNATIPVEVWNAFDQLPSETLPRKGARPTSRLSGLAQALAYDRLVPNATKLAHTELLAVLDGLAARYADIVDEARQDVRTVDGETIIASIANRTFIVDSTFTELADDRTVDAEYRAAGRVLGKDIAARYAERIADRDGNDDAFFAAHLQVAALAKVPTVADELNRAATALAERWLAEYRIPIKGLSDERQAVYAELIAMTGTPQPISVLRPKVRTESTITEAGNPVATRTHHLMSDDHGAFPVGSLGSWEIDVLDRELPHSTAWYRNPGRAADDALALAYVDGKGAWRRLFPDFIFFADVGGNIRPSIVDPHGYHLADALPKLRGLARFAVDHGAAFHRIEAVAKVDDTLRVLDLTQQNVRDAIAAASDAEALYRSGTASNY